MFIYGKFCVYRYDAHSGGEREIQRTMLELLNQLDGFDARADVKVILATNRIESLDPALLRPGRIDRKIEFPLPDIKTRRRIFQVHLLELCLLPKCVLGFSLMVILYLYITSFIAFPVLFSSWKHAISRNGCTLLVCAKLSLHLHHQ